MILLVLNVARLVKHTIKQHTKPICCFPQPKLRVSMCSFNRTLWSQLKFANYQFHINNELLRYFAVAIFPMCFFIVLSLAHSCSERFDLDMFISMHPSIGRSVCWLVGRSIGWTVGRCYGIFRWKRNEISWNIMNNLAKDQESAFETNKQIKKKNTHKFLVSFSSAVQFIECIFCTLSLSLLIWLWVSQLCLREHINVYGWEWKRATIAAQH